MIKLYAMILAKLSELTINSDELNNTNNLNFNSINNVCVQHTHVNQLQQIEYSFKTKLEIVFVPGPAR